MVTIEVVVMVSTIMHCSGGIGGQYAQLGDDVGDSVTSFGKTLTGGKVGFLVGGQVGGLVGVLVVGVLVGEFVGEYVGV